MTGQTFNFHFIYFNSLHSVDSVGLFVEMYPKEKHLDCLSAWVLQTWWQAPLIQRAPNHTGAASTLKQEWPLAGGDWMEFAPTLHNEYLLCSRGLEAEPSNSENHMNLIRAHRSK